jgi:hypothetical protein
LLGRNPSAWRGARPASPHGGRDELAAELRELDKDFELCATPAEEAVHVFLDGLAATLEAGTGYPLNYRDDGK